MFHLTIRDMLWLTALAALSLAWWQDRRADQSALQVASEQRHDLEWKLEVCAEALRELGFALKLADSSVELEGDFPDGSAAKGWQIFRGAACTSACKLTLP
jgi:hypothetical protein